jgi:hypothetical protein
MKPNAPKKNNIARHAALVFIGLNHRTILPLQQNQWTDFNTMFLCVAKCGSPSTALGT